MKVKRNKIIQFSKEEQENRQFNIIFIGVVLLISLLLQILLFIRQPVNVWGDEAYTLILIKNSWHNMWNIIINDVHPPLYYIIIKMATSIFGYRYRMIKAISALPIFIMHLWIAILVLKEKTYAIQRKTSVLLSLYIVSTTITDIFLFLSTEVRMYSWATLFVTMSGVYAYRFYKTGDWSNIFIFVATSLGAALSHYYALFMAAYIYLITLIFIIWKNRNLVKKYILACLITVLGYSWWIPFGWTQFNRVRASYWITYSFKDIPTYFSNIVGFDFKFEIIIVVLIIGEVVYSNFIIKNKKKQDKEKAIVALLNISVLFFSVVFGFLLDALIRPMLIPRYVYPSLGLFWLGIFELIDQMRYYKKITTLIMAGILGYVALNVYPARLAQEYETGTQPTISYVKENISLSEPIICDAYNIYQPMHFYFPKRNVLDIETSEAMNDQLENKRQTYWYYKYSDSSNKRDIIEKNKYNMVKKNSGNIDNVCGYTLYELIPRD